MTNNNPLAQYMRTEKFYIKLPSGGYYYDDSIIEMTNGEIGIMPMTALDEISLNTPDALLNGDGIKKAVASCVPGIKNVDKILMNDFDILLLAIRKASYGDSLPFEDKCPECEHVNEFNLSISNMLDNIEPIEPPFKITLDNDLEVFIKILSFKSTTTLAMKALATNQVLHSINTEALDNNEAIITELKEKYSKSIESIANLSIDTLVDGIDYIQIPQGQRVDNIEHITDLIRNLDKKSIDDIQKAISNIPNGYDKNIGVVCEECNHEWDTFVEFNPASFFGEDS